jgi:beta-glucanase (GH16 family)
MAYKLIWEDQFNQDGKPNPLIWKHETGGHGFGNNEAQFYTDRLDNAFVKDGMLHITAKKEDYEHCHYTSAKLTTYPNQLIHKGRIEVMAKLPKGQGTWPAIWFLSESFKQGTPWPTCGEIDLLEHVGHNPGHIHFSLHSNDYFFHNNKQPTFITKIENADETFHEYRMDWESDQISFYVDQIHQVTFKKDPNATFSTWPFDQPFYLILNIALGGTWGGPINDQTLPSVFSFKYVKVYEKRDES